FRADALQNLKRVFAAPHDDDAHDDVILIRLARHDFPDAAPSQLMADLHFAEVADFNRRAVPRVHGDVADVVEALDKTESAHDIKFGTVFNVGAARVLIAIGQRGKNLAQRDAVGTQFRGINQHLILLGRTAEAVHVHDAGHSAE